MRAILALLLFCSVARAQAPEDVARAKNHFEAGRALFTLGNYSEAVQQFLAGYQLVPKPRFLLNIGQSYRMLHEPEKAREMLQKYLDAAPPDDPERKSAAEALAAIDRERAAAPAPPATPLPSEVTPPPSPAPSMVAAAPVEKPAPAPRSSGIRRYWWTIPLGAAVVASAIVGIYFGTRPAVDCGSVGLGCVDARH